MLLFKKNLGRNDPLAFNSSYHLMDSRFIALDRMKWSGLN